MRKSIMILGLSALAMVACREQEEPEKETVIIKERVEQPAPAATPAEPERKGILERAGERVDKEVNKEINEEINKIGDDN